MIELNQERTFKEKPMLALEKLFSSSDKTFQSKMGSSGKEQNLTPSHIAKEMVQAVVAKLKPEDWNKDLKILDFYCKSGIFLYFFYFELFNRTRHLYIEDGLSDAEIDANCIKHIIENQLYGICTDPFLHMMSIRTAYGYIPEHSNIKLIKNFDSVVNNKNPKLFWETIKENFGEDTMKKFSVVIGNPPYNSDAYLDFVTKGHQLSSNLTCMITPAKWQAKTDAKVGKDGIDKNEQFRKDVVPYMSDIVFYPDTRDIFDISEWGGISHFITKKSIPKQVLIKTSCNNSIIVKSDYEIHDETTPNLWNRNILSIIGKAGTLGGGFKQSLYVKNTDHGEETIAGTLGFKRQVFTGEQERGEAIKQAGYVEVMQGEKVCGYKKKSELFTDLNLDKYKVITTIIVSGNSDISKEGYFQRYFNAYYIKPNQVPKGSFPVLKYFDTESECKSFISYTETKLFKFLFCIGVCGTTLTKEFFRFIPDPGKFDHIFTDAELYKKYNLTDEEIKIIESVIKERK